MKQKKSIGLLRFLKGTTNPKDGTPGCANYDHNYGGCLFEDACKVEQGARCGFFEQAVLPTAVNTGRRDEIYQQYEVRCNVAEPLSRTEIRRCPDCGVALKFRQRFCQDHTRMRRQAANRESQQKYRESKRMTVSS